MKKPRITHEPDSKIGIYYWVKSDGTALTNDNHDVLSITSFYGDIRKINRLIQFAESLGYGDGWPEWAPDVKKIDDEEFQSQFDRMLRGETPDPLDLGAIYEDVKRNH